MPSGIFAHVIVFHCKREVGICGGCTHTRACECVRVRACARLREYERAPVHAFEPDRAGKQQEAPPPA